MSRRGPKTPEGKRNSSLNSLRHGINSEGFLKCKRSRCFYQQICILFSCPAEAPTEDELPYGADCPLEVELHHDTSEALRLELPNESEDVIAEFARLEVLKLRISGMSALDAHLLREIPFKGTAFTRPAFSLHIRYRLSYLTRFMRLHEYLADKRLRQMSP